MKIKSLFSVLFCACLFSSLFAVSAQAADDWGGYRRIERNRLVSIYVKVENREYGYSDVTWRGVNHTNDTLHVRFRPVYYGENDDFTSYISEQVFSKGSDGTYLGSFSTYGKGLGHIDDIEIREFEIREKDQYGDVIYRD